MRIIKNFNDFIIENLNGLKELEELVENIFDNIKENFDIDNFKKTANAIGVLEYEYKTEKGDKIKLTNDKFYIGNDIIDISKKLFDKIREFFIDIVENEKQLIEDKKAKEILKKYQRRYIKKEVDNDSEEDIEKEKDTTDTEEEIVKEKDTTDTEEEIEDDNDDIDDNEKDVKEKE